jgi:hypothetical protein
MGENDIFAMLLEMKRAYPKLLHKVVECAVSALSQIRSLKT